MSNAEKWLWLAEKIGPARMAGDKLASHFGTIDKIYSATAAEYKVSPCGLREKDIEALCNKNLDSARKVASECSKIGVRVITRESDEYPQRLRNTDGAPLVLYARGARLDIDDELVIAIVGTRRATAYGENAAKLISREIAEAGGIVVTGLAKGIDAVAAESAISCGGKCIGVLGCGIDIYYPSENEELIEATAKNGTLISEYPPGQRPSKITFPQRNRIISGLSLGTVVVEAPEKSGALITAKHALEQNRDIFAVPSGIFEKAGSGSNLLIRQGAVPVMSGEDVIAEYRMLFGDRLKPSKTAKSKAEPRIEEDEKFSFPDGYLEAFSQDDRAILSAISGGTPRPDEIAAACSFPIPKVLSLLTLLEIRGIVGQVPGNRFRIKDIK